MSASRLAGCAPARCARTPGSRSSSPARGDSAAFSVESPDDCLVYEGEFNESSMEAQRTVRDDSGRLRPEQRSLIRSRPGTSRKTSSSCQGGCRGFDPRFPLHDSKELTVLESRRGFLAWYRCDVAAPVQAQRGSVEAELRRKWKPVWPTDRLRYEKGPKTRPDAADGSLTRGPGRRPGEGVRGQGEGVRGQVAAGGHQEMQTRGVDW